MNKSVFIRMIRESLLIVFSILLALSADAWLDSRNLASQQDRQVISLARDFNRMKERVDASYFAANRGVEAGIQLSNILQEGSEIEPELARDMLWHLIFYEVFSPSVGAYDALVASGNIEFLSNSELKIELADFFWLVRRCQSKRTAITSNPGVSICFQCFQPTRRVASYWARRYSSGRQLSSRPVV